jgi:hypothetical protein
VPLYFPRSGAVRPAANGQRVWDQQHEGGSLIEDIGPTIRVAWKAVQSRIDDSLGLTRRARDGRCGKGYAAPAHNLGGAIRLLSETGFHPTLGGRCVNNRVTGYLIRQTIYISIR